MAEERPEGNMKRCWSTLGGAGLSRRRMEIPVGPGTQSLKWLGLVAASATRCSLSTRRRGDDHYVKQPDEGQGFFLPEDMIGPGGSSSRHVIIRDVIREGEYTDRPPNAVELDEINAPKQTPWQVAAFECGAAGARRRRGIESREAIAARGVDQGRGRRADRGRREVPKGLRGVGVSVETARAAARDGLSRRRGGAPRGPGGLDACVWT